MAKKKTVTPAKKPASHKTAAAGNSKAQFPRLENLERTMPTLNWIGKEAVVNHHQQVPFHLLQDVPELACGNPGEGKLIVQGDNLVALKVGIAKCGKMFVRDADGT